MKKVLMVFMLMTCCGLSYAQRTRLNVYSSYVFNDGVSSYYNNANYFDGRIDGGYQWGLGLEFAVRPYYNVEVLYQRQDSHAPLNYQTSNMLLPKYTNFEVDMNYIMVGFTRVMPTANRKLEGFAGLQAGMAVIAINNPDNGNSGSAEKFAWGLKLGANIWAGERVGIKLQGQMQSVVQGAGGGLYFGTGGAGVGVSTYSTVYQFSLGGGLVVKMGR